ncbi:MAG: amidohydrolase family protein [Candidatus Scalinduaceae bacterium]
MSRNFDLIIKNGVVVDGAGKAKRVLDIGIQGDRIVYMGNITLPLDCNIIDASGCIVTPGFIDIHSHSDFFWLVSPKSESKIYDGVTTEICGNCGTSAFPLRGQLLENRRKGLSKFGLDINWQTAKDFFKRTDEVPSSINRGFLVGHGNIRACILGYEDREPDKNELVSMEKELRDAMEAGAFGISSGLVYPPGCYAKTSELIELCKIVKEHNGIYTTHMRDEGDKIETALAETINIARMSGVNTQVSHIKTWGERNWEKIGKIERLLSEARSDGIKISCDRYPYIASGTDLDVILPNWVYEGGAIEEKKRLKDPLYRERIIKDMTHEGKDQKFWESIMISSVHDSERKDYEGKTVAKIAKTLKVSPLEFVLDLLIAEDCRVGVLFFNMSDENLDKILSWDFVMIGSDSSLRSTSGALHFGRPHPRCYGTFSSVIRKYVNEKNLFSIEEAIYKMTGLPAQKIGFKDRGVLKEGFFADVTIFDQNVIAEKATFADPHNYSEGIKYVLVNGKLTIKDGEHVGAMNGVVLRR